MKKTNNVKTIKNKDFVANNPIIDASEPKNQKIKKYRFRDYMSRLSVQFWVEFYKAHTKRKKLYLVRMQLRNGKDATFTIATNKPYFTYEGGTYLIDADKVREDIHTSLNSLYYHQDISTPFKIEFDIDEMRNQISASDDDVLMALNPKSLKHFIKSEVIEKVLKGQEITNEMKFIKMVTILNLCVAIGTLAILGKSIGWF